MISINFEEIFNYRPIPPIWESLPALPVRLITTGGEIDSLAILDSGATYCIFDGRLSDSIGLDLRSGTFKRLSSLGGGFLQGYLHTIDMEINGYRFNDCEVVFSESPINRNLLGRHSFFDKIKVGFAEIHEEVYFSPCPQR